MLLCTVSIGLLCIQAIFFILNYAPHFLLKRNVDFDIERMRAAAKQIEGYHDFRSFMKTSKEQKTVRISK